MGDGQGRLSEPIGGAGDRPARGPAVGEVRSIREFIGG